MEIYENNEVERFYTSPNNLRLVKGVFLVPDCKRGRLWSATVYFHPQFSLSHDVFSFVFLVLFCRLCRQIVHEQSADFFLKKQAPEWTSFVVTQVSSLRRRKKV
jgi:hypothetical protein